MTNKVIHALSKGIYLFSPNRQELRKTNSIIQIIKNKLFKKSIVKPKATLLDIIINAFISQHKAEAMRFKPILIKLWLNKLNLKK